MRRVATVLSAVVLALSACGPKLRPLSVADTGRPLRVLVVTIDREPVRPPSWRPGVSIGLGFGSAGGSVSGGVGVSGEGGPGGGLHAFLERWDFREELHRRFVTFALPPGPWIWVDGDQAGDAVRVELEKLNRNPSAATPAADAYAAAERIDLFFVLDPVAWGLGRVDGLVVDLKGRLFHVEGKPRLAWEADGHPKKGRRPFFDAGLESERDRDAVRAAVMESASESIADLMSKYPI